MKENIEEDLMKLEKFSNETVLYGSTVAMTLERYKNLQLSTEHILSDYKRVLKENEELLREKIDNKKIIALAQNEFLGYEQGYQDGKAGRGSATQAIIEGQQYYIIQEQIERYENQIKRLQKENEELKENNERLESENQEFLYKYGNILKENEELKERWDKDTHILQNDLDIANAKIIDWEKAYQEEKDKQFELLRENQLAKEALKKQCDIADERNQLLIENQKLQKENEELLEIRISAGAHNRIIELERENEKLERANKCYINSIHSIVPVLNQDYIEKQKIKDKIEELEPELKFEITEREARLQINLLKSLLEEE